jgi:hypothetical protein
MLWVIGCVFNPAGFRSAALKLREFRQRLPTDRITIVEVSWNGAFVYPDTIHLHATDNNVLWQKERLLNIAIQQLPVDVDKVAWVDTDLLFLNRSCFDEAEEKLNHFPVVQLFDTAVNLGANHETISERPSWGAALEAEQSPGLAQHHVGYAWAARREILSDGLYDRMIVGGADWYMAIAWLGRHRHLSLSALSHAQTRHYLEWADRQHAVVKSRVGCIPGAVHHVFHGTERDRCYYTRSEPLLHYEFDPEQDITLDANGLWKWNSDKPELHAAVRRYFSSRNEDALDSVSRSPLISTMSTDECRLLNQYFSECRHLLEYGLGESTVFASCISSILSIDTVESSERFAADFLRRNRGLADEIRRGRMTIHEADIGETRNWGYPVQKSDKWTNYLSITRSIRNPIDTVLIDGRFRVASLAHASYSFADVRYFLFHDFWNRMHYHESLRCFDVVETADTLVVLRRKQDCTQQQLADLRDQYREDPR